YYRKLGSQWVGVKDIVHPEEGLEVAKLPTCQQCRAPILASVTKRYGRVIKAAALAITERHYHLNLLTQYKLVIDAIDQVGKLARLPMPPAAGNLDSSDPVRQLHGAGARQVIANDEIMPRLRAAFEKSVAIKQDFVEGGRVNYLSAVVMRFRLMIRFQLLKHYSGKLKPLAEVLKALEGELNKRINHLDDAVAMFTQGVTPLRVLESRIEALALHKVYIDALVGLLRGMHAARSDVKAHVGSIDQYAKYFADVCHLTRDGVLPCDPEIAQVIMAVAQMEGAAGHWFRCPNGHPFVIGDCGGAMQTGWCLECGEAIGGASHRLLQSNSSANDLVASASRAVQG
ncbi:NFX1-type zinc finger-containing protein 1, partial [Allomyces javanicus]